MSTKHRMTCLCKRDLCDAGEQATTTYLYIDTLSEAEVRRLGD